MFSNPIYVARSESGRLLNDVTKAINGEYSAIACYDQLAQMAPDETSKRRILEIRMDEIRHYQAFSHLYFQLTGSRPTPQITESCAKEYRNGLESALTDEQETVDFYHEIADQARNLYVKELFRRAAADEQNHAVWFLYLYTKST